MLAGMITVVAFNEGHDGLHIALTCENHPELRWSCKKIALSLDTENVYRYNGNRNIFYFGPMDQRECDCSSRKIYALVEGHLPTNVTEVAK